MKVRFYFPNFGASEVYEGYLKVQGNYKINTSRSWSLF